MLLGKTNRELQPALQKCYKVQLPSNTQAQLVCFIEYELKLCVLKWIISDNVYSTVQPVLKLQFDIISHIVENPVNQE